MYFVKRMAEMEKVFNDLWRDMSLNDSQTEQQASAYAVWHYPIRNKYTRLWNSAVKNGLTQFYKQAIDRVKNSTSLAFITDAGIVDYFVSKDCDYARVKLGVIDEKSYAFGLQPGSPLKAKFDPM